MKKSNKIPEILEKCKSLLQNDNISLHVIENKMFLVQEKEREVNCDNRGNYWTEQNSTIQDFAYTGDYLIASGYDEEELLDNVTDFLLNIETPEDFFTEIVKIQEK